LILNAKISCKCLSGLAYDLDVRQEGPWGYIVKGSARRTSESLTFHGHTSPWYLINWREQSEIHFQNGVWQRCDGRIEVWYPFSEFPPNVRNSFGGALKRFWQLERSFKHDPATALEYKKFVNKFFKKRQLIELEGHLYKWTQVRSFFIPHHAVYKRSKGETAKIRVVFDVSASPSLGESLNKKGMQGPVCQPSFKDLLLLYRLGKYALTADIQKMYPQIKLHPDN
jgi:hypothetical protein